MPSVLRLGPMGYTMTDLLKMRLEKYFARTRPFVPNDSRRPFYEAVVVQEMQRIKQRYVDQFERNKLVFRANGRRWDEQ